jgi:hypothetical protein
MRKQTAKKRASPVRSSQWFSDILEASRAVVRAHQLRDKDEASDDDVSDAIAGLKNCLHRRRKVQVRPA